MSPESITVLVVDDHEIVRRGIRALLATEPDIEVLGEAEDGRQALSMADQFVPDVILMDLVMPEMDGIEATRAIRARQPDCEILVLTSFGSDDKIFPAIKAGALGYLLKDTSPAELVQAIRQAARGQASLNPTIAGRLLRQFSAETERAVPSEPLTDREIDVLRLLATGLTNEQIGVELDISDATVRTHVSHLLAKLEMGNRTQAALWALREGLASLDEMGDPKR
jgi:NarL family two-component system response regulator LiaR